MKLLFLVVLAPLLVACSSLRHVPVIERVGSALAQPPSRCDPGQTFVLGQVPPPAEQEPAANELMILPPLDYDPPVVVPVRPADTKEENPPEPSQPEDIFWDPWWLDTTPTDRISAPCQHEGGFLLPYFPLGFAKRGSFGRVILLQININ